MTGQAGATEIGDLKNQAKVTAALSKSEVRVAEPFDFNLTVTAPIGTKVSLPTIGNRFGDFDVSNTQDVNDIPSDVSPEQRIWTRRMTLESIVAGDLQIPAIEIQASSQADSQSISSQAIPVRVISVLEGSADPTQFREIQTVVDVNVPQPTSNRWIVWTLGGLGLLTFSAAAVAVVARRKTWLTPLDWALKEMDILQSSDAMRANESETITQNLSSVLRDFLELQFEISAPVQTTNELLAAVEYGEFIKPNIAKRFGKLFAIADGSKFAGLQLSQTQIEKVFSEARNLIEAASEPMVVSAYSRSSDKTPSARTRNHEQSAEKI